MTHLREYFAGDAVCVSHAPDPIPLGHHAMSVPDSSDWIDTDEDGFFLPHVLTGEPMSHAAYTHLRYILGEASEFDPGVLKAFFILGAGGSGKGTISKDMLAGRGLKYINQDTHLERLLGDADIPLSKAGSNYGIFKQAQGLSRKERDAYAQQRLGLHIEMTGWDYRRISKPVKALRKLGYDCYAIIILTSEKTALARNWQRGLSGGRLVPKHSVKTAVSGLKSNVSKYLKLFGKKNTLVINNDAPQDPDHWRTVIAPELARAGDKLLARPVQNPRGKEWLQAARAARQAESQGRPTLRLPTTLLNEART